MSIARKVLGWLVVAYIAACAYSAYTMTPHIVHILYASGGALTTAGGAYLGFRKQLPAFFLLWPAVLLVAILVPLVGITAIEIVEHHTPDPEPRGDGG